MRHCDRDRGALEIPGIVKIAIAIAVLVPLGYDGFVTVATHLKTESDAQNAAYAASTAWENTTGTGSSPKNAQTAFQAALTYLAANGSSGCTKELTAESQGAVAGLIPEGCDYVCADIPSQSTVCGSHGLFMVDADGTVHLVLRRQAKTLIFGHLGFMHSLLVAYEQGDANQSQD
jgi:hypothetical protein